MGRECFTEIRCQPYAEKTADSDGFAHPPPAAGAGAGKNIFARCGACFATRQVFGPGVFTVRARLNPTAWKEMGGRGYVFAAWTFSYGEVYALQSEGGAPRARQAPRGTYCYNDCSCEGDSSCDATFDGKPCVPGQRKLADHPYFKGAPPASASDPRPPADYRAVCSGDVLYAALNHEIDIEIPANSPGLDWTKDLTWSTMNCNTWVGDIDYYDGSMPWYSQAMVELKKEQPNFADGQFHDFTIDWYVDRHDATKSYVKFLVDGRVLYVTRRFVPTRSGRLVVGPWPGWWGSGRDASGAQQAPAFDVGYVDIAALTINPYSPATCDVQIRTFPQTFDQILPAGVQTVECSPVGAAAGTSAAQQVQCAIQCDYREIGADDGNCRRGPRRGRDDGAAGADAARAPGAPPPRGPRDAGRHVEPRLPRVGHGRRGHHVARRRDPRPRRRLRRHHRGAAPRAAHLPRGPRRRLRTRAAECRDDDHVSGPVLRGHRDGRRLDPGAAAGDAAPRRRRCHRGDRHRGAAPAPAAPALARDPITCRIKKERSEPSRAEPRR